MLYISYILASPACGPAGLIIIMYSGRPTCAQVCINHGSVEWNDIAVQAVYEE